MRESLNHSDDLHGPRSLGSKIWDGVLDFRDTVHDLFTGGSLHNDPNERFPVVSAPMTPGPQKGPVVKNMTRGEMMPPISQPSSFAEVEELPRR